MITNLAKTLKLEEKLNGQKIFILYLFALTALLLVEGVMCYYFPIVLEQSFGSNLGAGVIISCANIVALACDFLIPELFKKRTWKFLLLAAVIIQILFPAFVQISLISQAVEFLVVASVFWNIYYEFMAFSRHNFIVSNVKKEDYSRDWGLISIVSGFTSIVGPIIGSNILRATIVESSTTLAALELVAVLIILLLVSLAPNKPQEHKLTHHVKIKWSILRELKLWEVLGRRVLPVILMGIMLAIQLASVTTVGGLLGEKILGEEHLDWLLIFMFNVPGILVALLLARVQVPRFKKLLSQISLILSGVPFVLLPFVSDSPVWVIILFFVSSIFSSLAWIFNEAVYSDLSRRSGDQKLYINSMERLNDSIGYLIGPVLIGFLSDRLGYFVGFQIVGGICVIMGAILLMITPRKILIPHQEIDELEKTKFQH